MSTFFRLEAVDFLALFLILPISQTNASTEIKTLRIGLRSGKPSTDPYKVRSMIGRWFIDMVSDTLVRSTSEGSLAPGLAESWHYDISQKRYIFNLDKKIKNNTARNP